MRTFDVGFECSTNELAATHPSDMPLGGQTVRIAAGDLAEGETVEVTADMLVWQSSYKADVDCVYVPDKGDVCTCTWDYRESIDLARGKVTLEAGLLHVDLRGGEANPEYLLWGAFTVQP